MFIECFFFLSFSVQPMRMICKREREKYSHYLCIQKIGDGSGLNHFFVLLCCSGCALFRGNFRAPSNSAACRCHWRSRDGCSFAALLCQENSSLRAISKGYFFVSEEKEIFNCIVAFSTSKVHSFSFIFFLVIFSPFPHAQPLPVHFPYLLLIFHRVFNFFFFPFQFIDAQEEESGFTALMFATASDAPEIVYLLLKAGADVMLQCKSLKWTALHW